MEYKGDEFLEKVASAFWKAKQAANPNRYRLIDGSETKEEVFEMLWKVSK